MFFWDLQSLFENLSERPNSRNLLKLIFIYRFSCSKKSNPIKIGTKTIGNVYRHVEDLDKLQKVRTR